jgi:hypothetical protein
MRFVGNQDQTFLDTEIKEAFMEMKRKTKSPASWATFRSQLVLLRKVYDAFCKDRPALTSESGVQPFWNYITKSLKKMTRKSGCKPNTSLRSWMEWGATLPRPQLVLVPPPLAGANLPAAPSGGPPPPPPAESIASLKCVAASNGTGNAVPSKGGGGAHGGARCEQASSATFHETVDAVPRNGRTRRDGRHQRAATASNEAVDEDDDTAVPEEEEEEDVGGDNAPAATDEDVFWDFNDAAPSSPDASPRHGADARNDAFDVNRNKDDDDTMTKAFVTSNPHSSPRQKADKPNEACDVNINKDGDTMAYAGGTSSSHSSPRHDADKPNEGFDANDDDEVTAADGATGIPNGSPRHDADTSNEPSEIIATACVTSSPPAGTPRHGADKPNQPFYVNKNTNMTT